MASAKAEWRLLKCRHDIEVTINVLKRGGMS